MLWNPQEIAELQALVASDEPWVQRRLAEMKKWKRQKPWYNLFAYAILGDQKAGQAEKKYLLRIVGTHPRTYEEWEHGGRHFDCTIDALRYDVLYDLLTPEEREQIAATFRDYIAYQMTDDKVYNHLSWLPNMQWPRPMTASYMAVALRDEQLIRDLWASNGGWKMYYDDNLLDKGFYIEEFGKMTAMVGQKLIYGRSLQRLGLNELGFGYVGKHGATTAGFMSTYMDITYPQIKIPGGMPHFGTITMGDSKGGAFKRRKGDTRPAAPRIFQRNIIPGFFARPRNRW